jgi:hypothetical protein
MHPHLRQWYSVPDPPPSRPAWINRAGAFLGRVVYKPILFARYNKGATFLLMFALVILFSAGTALYDCASRPLERRCGEYGEPVDGATSVCLRSEYRYCRKVGGVGEWECTSWEVY